MYKVFSGTLPVDCMGIRIGNPLVPKDTHDPINPWGNHFMPGWAYVEEILYSLKPNKITDPDWAIRGHFQNMSWPQKPIFWLDPDGPDLLWVSAHPSDGDCSKDFKFTNPKGMYGFQDNQRTYLMQVTSGEAFSRRFPHCTNIIMPKRIEESLETAEQLYF